MKTQGRLVDWVLMVVAGLLLVGCQRDGDAVRQQLAVRRAGWARDIATLQKAAAEARASLDAIPSAAGGPDAMVRRRGMAAVLDGDRQALIDVDIQVGQIGQRIEEAIGAGGDAGRQMLEEESARIGGYLQAMRQRIPEARQGVAALTRAREPETARN